MIGGGGWAIGIDVGGTKIAGGLVDPATGDQVVGRTLSTDAERGGAAILADVIALARELAADASVGGGQAVGLGVGVPEIVDPNGVVTSTHNFDWRDLPVAARLDEVAPSVIAADVRAAALAEARFGAGRGFRSFVYVSVGTGISSAIVLDGRPWPGARGAALVLSSGPTSTPAPHGAGLGSFVLETYASGPALEQRYRDLTGESVSGAADVIDAAKRGDKRALTTVVTAATALGSAIGLVANVVDPEAIVVGGGLGSAPGPFWETLAAATRRHIWHTETRTLPIRQALLGPAAGWIGAALAASDRIDGDRSTCLDVQSPASVAAGRR